MPYIECNDIDLYYEERGRGDPLVLIIGLGADGSLWEEHANAYEQHFRCILVDNRGAGRSGKPAGPYSTEQMAGDTIALMDALGIAGARVAGISMGSAVAQQLALRHPGRVRSMVLISSWARCDRYMKDVFEHFIRIRPLVPAEYFMQLLQLWIYASPHFERNYADLVEGRYGGFFNPMPDHAFAAQSTACIEHDTLDLLDRIEVPTMITVGDADIFTPLRCSREIHERMHGSRLLIFPGKGHCHHWEDLDRFNAETTAFLLDH